MLIRHREAYGCLLRLLPSPSWVGNRLQMDFFCWAGLETFPALPLSALLQRRRRAGAVPPRGGGTRQGEVRLNRAGRIHLPLALSRSRIPGHLENLCNLPKDVFATVAETVP